MVAFRFRVNIEPNCFPIAEIEGSHRTSTGIVS